MKITTQLVIMVGIVVVGMVGLVLGLAVFADWSDGAIIGMVSGFGTVAAGLIMAVRNQQLTTETLAEQDVKLDTITAQTNGMSEIERQDVAKRAAIEVAEMIRGGRI